MPGFKKSRKLVPATNGIGTAVVAYVQVDITKSVTGQVAADSSDNTLTRSFFAISQNLAHERPKHNRGGVRVTQEPVVFVEDTSDALFAEDVNKRQPGRCQKSTDGLPKSEVASVGGIGTKSIRKPSLVSLFWQAVTKEGFKQCETWEGFTARRIVLRR